MRTASGNSWAPPAVQAEDFAAPSTSVLPAAWREICKEQVKVKVFPVLLNAEVTDYKKRIQLPVAHRSFAFPTGRLMRCIRCPVAYHTGDSCVAAGSVVLTHHIMICSSHGSTKRNGLLTSPINVSWCFLCARGKRLNVTILLIVFPSCSPIISLAP